MLMSNCHPHVCTILIYSAKLKTFCLPSCRVKERKLLLSIGTQSNLGCDLVRVFFCDKIRAWPICGSVNTDCMWLLTKLRHPNILDRSLIRASIETTLVGEVNPDLAGKAS